MFTEILAFLQIFVLKLSAYTEHTDGQKDRQTINP